MLSCTHEAKHHVQSQIDIAEARTTRLFGVFIRGAVAQGVAKIRTTGIGSRGCRLLSSKGFLLGTRGVVGSTGGAPA